MSMMKKIKNLLCCLSILFFAACETTKDLDLPIPYAGDKFVIQGFVSEQEGVWAVISRTTDPNDKTDDPKVSNIKVTLFEDNKIVGELKETKESYYSSDFQIKSGKKYHLTVEGMGLEKTITPQVSTIPLVKIKQEKLLKKDSFLAVLSFQFKDETGDNTYQVEVNQYTNKQKWVSDNPFYEYFSAFSFFNDKAFEGKNKDYAQNVSLYRNISGKYIFADEIEVKLFSFSPDLKHFLESVFKAEGTAQLPFYDPLPVYNNVDGGFGIFAAYSADVVRIRVP
jgi:hypothetical protein